MGFTKLLAILLILLLLTNLSVFAQNPLEKEIIGLKVLKSDNQEVEKQLREKGFFIKPATGKQIYIPYLNSPLPIYVTADSMLQTFHTLYRESVSNIEEANRDKLLTLLNLLSDRTIGALSLELKDKVRLALEKNFLALQLLTSLLDTKSESFQIPVLIKEELLLIESASKIQVSPILGVKIDYRQLKAPKGISEKRAKLFCALAWMEYWQLDLSSELGANQTFLLLQEFAVDERLLLFWKEIDEPFSYLFGRVNTLNIEKIVSIIKYILGPNPATLTEISEEHLGTFQRLVSRSKTETQIFSLFGKRATLKEKLIENLGEKADIIKLDFAKIFNFETSKTTNLKLREALLLWQERNPQSYSSQLIDCFRALLSKKRDGRLPYFVNTSEWQNSLSTAVSISWIANQSIIAPPLKSATLSPTSNRYYEDFHGYVEPNPEFFFAIKKMSNSLRDILLKMRIFIPELDEFIKMSITLERIVNKQLSATPLFEEEIDLLENFAETLARLNFIAGDYQAVDFEQIFTLRVKNNLNSYQLLAGKVLTLYLAVPYKNKIYLCQGALFTAL